MDRTEEMDLDGFGVSRGIFAPSIRYKDGIFYVTCTLVDGGGNFIVTAKSPEGPWSKPAWIPQINGIDPSPFFDEDGKAYIVYNSVAPDNKPLYDGHRTSRMYEFDLATLKPVGKEMILVNGGADISKKPVWIEGPHIFKKGVNTDIPIPGDYDGDGKTKIAGPSFGPKRVKNGHCEAVQKSL